MLVITLHFVMEKCILAAVPSVTNEYAAGFYMILQQSESWN